MTDTSMGSWDLRPGLPYRAVLHGGRRDGEVVHPDAIDSSPLPELLLPQPDGETEIYTYQGGHGITGMVTFDYIWSGRIFDLPACAAT